jgi:hypothetical protein
MDGRLFKPCHFGRAFFILQFRVIVQTEVFAIAIVSGAGWFLCTITLKCKTKKRGIAIVIPPIDPSVARLYM